MRGTARTLLAVLLPLALLVAGCGDDGAGVRSGNTGSGSGAGSGSGVSSGSDTGSEQAAAACEPVGDPASADTTVTLSLDEWSIQPSRDSVPAGAIAFDAENDGTMPHEVVVVKADSPDALPTTDNGGFDEGAIPDDQLIGEIEPFPAGQDCTGVFDLQPGSYVLLCNISEGDLNHFAKGMVATFTVTG